MRGASAAGSRRSVGGVVDEQDQAVGALGQLLDRPLRPDDRVVGAHARAGVLERGETSADGLSRVSSTSAL